MSHARLYNSVIIFLVFTFPGRLLSQAPFEPHHVTHGEFLTRNKTSQETGSLDLSTPELHRRFKLFAGVSLPMGDFANKSISSGGSGFAQIGLSGGLEYTHELMKGLGFILSGMVSAYGQDVSDWKNVYPWFTFDGETHFDYWAMGGMLLDKDFSPKVTGYGFVQLGMLYADYPNLTALDAVNGKLTITAPEVITLGYSAGIGMNIGNYDFSFRYLSGDPEFKPAAKLNNQKLDYGPIQKPVKAIQLMVGYIVN